MFSDLALSRRLERAEGHACAQFAASRRRLLSGRDAEWMEVAGGFAAFDGVDSPVTQCFGLGLFDDLSPEVLDEVESFFFRRGAAAMLEISPFAGVAALDLLCDRGYRPVETSSVLFRPVEDRAPLENGDIRVRVIGPEDSPLWVDVCARGWAHEVPELDGFLREMGPAVTNREDSILVLGEVNGQPGAAGVLCLHDGVALFGGSATVPELRRRGLQSALLHERMRYAFQHGCDVAMMVAGVGSDSQRNAERKGFRIAYTRTKWRLAPS